MIHILKCKFCNKEYKNKRSLIQHEIRCKLNPNKIDTSKSFNNGNRPAWNKGLTKETDKRVTNYSKKISKSISKLKTGKPLSDAHKKAISNSMHNFLINNPDKVPYKLNHSSKISYPEQYFIDLFKKENINLKYHVTVGLYELDFYNENKKIDIEIDGEQHYVDKRIINSDIRRTKYLENLGWKIYRIRWSYYKRLSYIEKTNIINQIKLLLL